MDDVLKKYKELLIQKRYSNNTQRIYCNYFKDFNSYFKDNDLDKLSTEQINNYILYLIQSKNISISQQNQRINAIKFYYEKLLGRNKQHYALHRPNKEHKFPKVDEQWFDDSVEKEMKLIVEVATALRNLRGEMGVPPGKKIDAIFRGDASELSIIQSDVAVLKLLAKVGNLKIIENDESPNQCAKAVAGNLEIFVPMAGLVDLQAEKSRLVKEIEKIKKLIQGTQGKLSNENFIFRAPENVVNAEREKLATYREKLGKLEEHLTKLEGKK